MSLLRLLTAGKSLVGLQNVASRYRMRSSFLLPRFGRTEDPFAAATTPVPVATLAPAEKVERYQMSPAELAAARLKETKKLPMASMAPPPPPATRTMAAADLRLRIISWARAMNPLAWWQRRRRTTGKSVIAATSRAPVQGELSLDRVKVMRNDLSDADVEIVPMKPAAKAPAPAKSAATPMVRDEIEALNTD